MCVLLVILERLVINIIIWNYDIQLGIKKLTFLTSGFSLDRGEKQYFLYTYKLVSNIFMIWFCIKRKLAHIM